MIRESRRQPTFTTGCYLVSRYTQGEARKPLVVYTQLDVHNQTQKEIATAQKFCEKAGLRREQLREHSLPKAK